MPTYSTKPDVHNLPRAALLALGLLASTASAHAEPPATTPTTSAPSLSSLPPEWRVAVRFDADDPSIYLERETANGFRRVCASPCVGELDGGYAYRVNGDDGPSRPFRLPRSYHYTSGITISADPGGRSRRAAGAPLIAVGAAVLAVGTGLATASIASQGVDESLRSDNLIGHGSMGIGLGLLGVGVGALFVGFGIADLAAPPVTTVSLEPILAPPPSHGLGRNSFRFTPTGFVF